MAKLVANAYGDALFQIAEEKNCIDEMMQEVISVKQAIDENSEFKKPGSLSTSRFSCLCRNPN